MRFEQTFMNFPIEIINLDEEFFIENEVDLRIKNVKIKMLRIDSLNISEDTIKFYIDLSNITKIGNYYVKINNYLPEDFKIVSLEPDMLRLIIKEKAD